MFAMMQYTTLPLGSCEVYYVYFKMEIMELKSVRVCHITLGSIDCKDLGDAWRSPFMALYNLGLCLNIGIPNNL
jgi:hypothetical protein